MPGTTTSMASTQKNGIRAANTFRSRHYEIRFRLNGATNGNKFSVRIYDASSDWIECIAFDWVIRNKNK